MHEALLLDVLVVDDSRVFRDLVALLLENDGFSVRTAVDGADALAQMEAQAPDALILDLMMPGLGGVEMLELISERSLAPDAYIVVLTADDDPGRPAELQKLGAREVVVKPIDSEQLGRSLRAHFDAKAVAAEL